MKYVVSYQLGPPDPYFHLFTVCYCSFTGIHTLVGLNSAWIQREIHCFFYLSSDLGEKDTFWRLFRIISSFIFTWVWFSFDGRISSVSPREARRILQQKLAEDSFIYLQKKGSVIQMKHLVNSGGRWETGPTFHFGSSAKPRGSVVTGCGFLFTVIPSLCWRHWTREGGSPADMRGVTKLKGGEKKKKKEQEEEELLVLRAVKGLEQMSRSRTTGKPATASRASSCVIWGWNNSQSLVFKTESVTAYSAHLVVG